MNQLPATTPPPQAPPGLPSADDRTMAMLCHLLGIFTGFVGPLILWLVKKDDSSYLDHHGKEALNFQLTYLLASFVLMSLIAVLMFVFIGLLLVPVYLALWVVALVFEILACIAASRGEWHRYPGSIRFIS